MATQQKFVRMTRSISAITLALLMFSSSLRAQIGDWTAVKNLPTGTRIFVKAQHNDYCGLEGATNDQLVCEVRNPRPFGTMVVTIPRAEVREVRTLPNQAKSAAIGAGIGAGTGAALAASRNRTSRGANAFFGALGGALFGLTADRIVSTVRLAIHRGKVIYKQ